MSIVVPSWVPGAVFYQVFPERFVRAGLPWDRPEAWDRQSLTRVTAAMYPSHRYRVAGIADGPPRHLPPPGDAPRDDLVVTGGRVSVPIPARSGRVFVTS
jgi:hypothetical protein